MESGRQRREAQSARAGEASVSKGLTRFAGAPAQVRIIGGQWKRTPLPVGSAPGLRPSPDRVRETVFNWLAHLVPDFSGVRGLDLFAGTGALGFELASRGAAHVTLVERNAVLAAQLQRTRDKLAAAAVTIMVADGLAFARATPDASFDVIFLDPPFDANLLAPALRESARLAGSEGLIYIESDAPVGADAAEACGLQVVRAGRAGRVHFHLLQKA